MLHMWLSTRCVIVAVVIFFQRSLSPIFTLFWSFIAFQPFHVYFTTMAILLKPALSHFEFLKLNYEVGLLWVHITDY